MIRLKLHTLAKKLGKNISEIAQETGINRNTITALFHGKADGIFFSTLDKICQRYQVDISDLIEFEKPLDEFEKPKMYRQIQTTTPILFWPKISAITKPNPKFFDEGLGTCDIFFAKQNSEIFWHTTASLNEMAKNVYQEYGKMEGKFHEMKETFYEYAKRLENIYAHHQKLDSVWDGVEFLNYFSHLKTTLEKFWSIAIFIDSFDVGFDNQEIGNIGKIYNFSQAEIANLLVLPKLNLHNQEQLEVLEFSLKIEKLKLKSKQEITVYLKKSLTKNINLQQHLEKYFDYENDLEKLAEKIFTYTSNAKLLHEDYKRLKSLSKKQNKLIKSILLKYKLLSNPLAFFAELAEMREYRNFVNQKIQLVWNNYLERLEKITNIEKAYLYYLTFEEIDNALHGLLDKDKIKERRDNGLLVSMFGPDYKICEGSEAQKIYTEIQEILSQSELGNSLAGKVGSQGYAQGIAKVINSGSDLKNFQKGDILVAKMTDDSMLETIKIAGAIITDEGGMLCHAAINSRIQGKPCIINTHNATNLIKNGDILAVRANHGTVRILKK